MKAEKVMISCFAECAVLYVVADTSVDVYSKL